VDTLVASVEVPASTAPSRPFGLLSTADLQPLPANWLDGLNRDRTGQGAVVTSTDFTPPHNAKTNAAGRAQDTGYLFFTYHSIRSTLFESAEYEAEAGERLRRNETIAIETIAQPWLDTLDAAAVTNASIVTVLAELEEALAENYGNLGLISMHPTMAYAGFNAEVLFRESSKIVTCLGTPVAVCAGFATENVLYGSGQITVYQGSVETYSANGSDLLNTNEHMALAERVNVLMADTYVVKGTVA
jgi:hypothetical protein